MALATLSRMIAAVYDTKPYDREQLRAQAPGGAIEWQFFDFRLDAETAPTAKGALATCAFVNDRADRPCLQALAAAGVRLLALRCTGYNNVDLAAARECGVTVTRVPSYSPYAVAEHAVALLLTLNRRIHRAFNRVREQNFSLAGLVGTGKIGRIAAQILRGFGMRVLASDAFPAREWAQQAGVEYVDVRTLLTRSDVVSLHLPLTPETRYLIRAETLELMKPGAFLLNVSRGGLIDTRALIAALKADRLGGVGLDVYEEEEGVFFEDLSGEVLHDDDLARLLTFPKVLVTAHQAFLTREALGDIARTTVANLEALAAGGPFVEGSVLAWAAGARSPQGA